MLGGPPSDVIELAPRRMVIAGRYEIVGLLGGGAMGTVYRARDRELDELVALKVLKKELASAPGMLSRFRREVKLARRVTHRNVARTFDIGEDGGDRFLTMELVDGESLATRLSRAGRLSLREVVAIAKDICAGLAAAHEAGVLHRDLKPDNVIVASDGRAVITDFGIARAVMEADARTAAGVFVGTPLYMAPEQVEGVADLDGRADLYALGAMIYELLTGRPAWQRESLVAIAAARLLAPPPDPRAFVPEIPDAAAALVQRLMARRRDDRPATALEVASALDALQLPSMPSIAAATGVRATTNKRVAILPLTTSGGEEETYLAYGIVEELGELLARVDGISVRPRVARSIVGTGAQQPREMGRLLDVDVVVDGTLRRVDDRAFVTLRLITVEDGFELWAQSLTRAAAEVLALAADAARAIAEALTVHLVVPTRVGGANAGAEDLFLKGRYYLYRGFGPNKDEAVDYLRRAHALAPDDARIAGVLAIALTRVVRADISGRPSLADEARAAAYRALELDSTRAEGRVALGTLHLAAGDGEKAAIELAGALRVARTSVEAMDAIGRLLVEAGELDEGLRLLEGVLAVENIAIARHSVARAYALLDDWDRVEETMNELPHDGGGVMPTALLCVRFMLWCADARRRGSILERLVALPVPDDRKHAVKALAEIAARKVSPEEMIAVFDQLVRTMPGQNRRALAFRAQLRAEVMLVAGKPAEALDALRAADEAHLFDIAWLDRCPLFVGVRGDATFAEVRRHVAARAQVIVAAYERARVGLRGRTKRPA